MQPGVLYGISLGVGDPELITLKGLRLLQQASVVAFPAGMRDKPGMAEQIVSPWLRTEQQKLPLRFPYVREESILIRAWKEAVARVWQYLKKGQDVAFVSIGDTSFYSTFTYLAQTLLQLHPQAVVQTVPGVCSPMAAAAVLGVPLTVGSQRLAILPALYCVKELEAVLEWADVAVLMKVSFVYQQVWQFLSQRQLLEASWVVERATLPNQTIYRDLRARPDLKLSYFSLLIVQCPPCQ
ncbi:MAG: precorrin-2 C(20)-methyltransferase [Prochloron sp. SP5CPC1]|nr:precorrin-2 C(20)-methyltransferase [Candidatus Paraprochloron terpiosi SP5CPC1]